MQRRGVIISLKKILFAVLFFAAANITFTPAQEVDEQLEQAIKNMRNFDMVAYYNLSATNFEEAKKMWDERTEKTVKAWEVIKSKKDAGIARIKQELKTIDDNGEKDDLFKLCISALLWNLGGLEQAETIGEIYRNTSFGASYNYVFYTAFEAAQTQDERAIPILLPILKDDKGTTYIAKHAMELKWPLTVEFIWGSFGNKGKPVLMEILEKSDNSVAVASSIGYLARAQHLEALPGMRHAARTGKGKTKEGAIRGLGIFGHPDDFDFLIQGLKQSSSENEQYIYLWALVEFDDERAVPHIIPFLKSNNRKVRNEAAVSLYITPTLEGLDALTRCAQEASEMEKQTYYNLYTYLKSKNLNPDSYLQLPEEERKQIVDGLRKYKEPSRSKTMLTRREFIEIIEYWKKQGRIDAFPADIEKEIDFRDIFLVATADDIPLLNEVTAALYCRLSDECLSDVKIISDMMHKLGRSRYRQ